MKNLKNLLEHDMLIAGYPFHYSEEEEGKTY